MARVLQTAQQGQARVLAGPGAVPSATQLDGKIGGNKGIIQKAGDAYMGASKAMEGFSTGFVKDALSLPVGIAKGIGGALGLKEQPRGVALEKALEKNGTAEKVGGVVSEVAQFATGDELLKGATEAIARIPQAAKAIEGIRTAVQSVKKAAPFLEGPAADWIVKHAGSGAQQALSAGTLEYARTGDAKKASSVAKAAGLISILGEPVTKIVTGAAKRVAGGLIGGGKNVIDLLVSNPRAAIEGITGDTAETLAKDSTKLRTAVKDIQTKASAEYSQNLKDLPKRLGRNPEVLQAGDTTTIKVDGKKYTLTMQGVKSKLTSALRQFGVDVNPKKGTFDFLEAPFVGPEQQTLKKVFSVVQDWKDTSPEGLDKLAIKIGQYRKAGTQSAELNSVIDAVKKNVREYLGDRVPQAKEMVQKYAQAQDKISAFNDYLATDGGFVGGTSENIATGKKIGTVLGKGKEAEQKMIESIPGGKDLLARQAGRTAKAGEGHQGGLGDLIRSAIATVITPESVAKVVAKTSLTSEEAKLFLESIKGMDTIKRGLYLTALDKVFTN